MVPWQNGGVVMWLDRGDMSLAGSLAFVNRDGHISTMRAGKDIAPPKLASPAPGTVSPLRMPPHIEWPAKPSAIVYDTAGNVWFNNAWDATLTKIDPAGHVTTLLMGEKQTGRPPGLPIRLTLGPDGAAWFARSHPTSEIARVEGSRAFAIPSRYGDVLALVPMGINGFWFVTKTQLVELTLAGKFVSALSLPAELQTIHNDPPLLTAGPNDTVWIARGSYLANMNEKGVLGQYTLPDATLGVRAMVSGCDGSLYVAESAPEVLRLPRNGKTFERYSIEYRQIDGFTRTDCTIWFVEGSNMPAGQQNVGTLSLK
jgi:streptogramin lyase